MKTCLYTPGIADHQGNPSANLGDLIIQEAVEREINSIFRDVEIFRLPSHVFPKKEHVAQICQSEIAIVGGSNLLESKMDIHKKWQVSYRQQLFAPKPILLGVGWRVYQDKPNFYTRCFLNLVLSRRWTHSVRDSYTLKQMKSAGIRNVINTGCMTMWPFIDFDFSKIPTEKAKTALVMITDYEPDHVADRHLLELLGTQYDQVIAWPQGNGDQAYLESLLEGVPGQWTLLEHTFDAFQSLLKSDLEFDYIGTRLHGGIKCLLSGRRSLVLEIDNRAKEIASDTGLPTLERGNFEALEQWIQGSPRPSIKLKEENISAWRSQFKSMPNFSSVHLGPPLSKTVSV